MKFNIYFRTYVTKIKLQGLVVLLSTRMFLFRGLLLNSCPQRLSVDFGRTASGGAEKPS